MEIRTSVSGNSPVRRFINQKTSLLLILECLITSRRLTVCFGCFLTISYNACLLLTDFFFDSLQKCCFERRFSSAQNSLCAVICFLSVLQCCQADIFSLLSPSKETAFNPVSILCARLVSSSAWCQDFLLATHFKCFYNTRSFLTFAVSPLP